jgi:hypothetical protein
MTERHSHVDRVAELLGLEVRVSAEQYAAHRRRLDERLRRAAREGRRKPARRRALTAAAALLALLGGLASLTSDARLRAGPSAVVLRRLSGDAFTADPHPYRNVGRSQVVAVMRAGTPTRQEGEERIPLAVEHVLRNETRKQLPAFHCAFDDDPPPPAPDQRLLVFLTFSGGRGWGCADVVPLNASSGESVWRGVERCAALLRAPDSPDAKALYDRLLAEGRDRLDEAAGCALCCRPDPRSADALLTQLRRLRDRLRDARAGGRDGRAAEDDFVQVARLAEVLAPLQEVRAVAPLLECVRLLPRGRRAPAYRPLPQLCKTAPADLKAEVRRLLAEELADREGDRLDQAAAAAAMGGLVVPSR